MSSPFTTAFPGRCLVLSAFFGFGGLAAHAQTTPLQTRGELLYTTHCIACHSSEMHWRDNRRANDWESLKVQVRRWQGNTGLQWDEADIAEVAGYLNDTIYQYPRTAGPVGFGLTGPSRRISAAR
ncbi:MAG: cytochrome C [Polaromonas sp.]